MLSLQKNTCKLMEGEVYNIQSIILKVMELKTLIYLTGFVLWGEHLQNWNVLI